LESTDNRRDDAATRHPGWPQNLTGENPRLATYGCVISPLEVDGRALPGGRNSDGTRSGYGSELVGSGLGDDEVVCHGV